MKSYVEMHIRGDAYLGGYTSGMTNCLTMSTAQLKEVSSDEEKTVYENPRSHTVIQYHEKRDGVTFYKTEFRNTSDEPVWLDMISSFALSGVEADNIYRMLSFWSAEGRLKVDSLVDLNMERSWSGHSVRSLKYGSVGSMPVKSYFPFMALEDTKTGHFIGIQLYAASSWQLEVLCGRDPGFHVAGGLADRDFGAWSKYIEPGESFTTPYAVIAEGDSLYDVCDLLVKAQHPEISPVDQDLPIIFNEFCTTWGEPSDVNLRAIADRIEGLGIKYLVIDCGWFCTAESPWYISNGDWIPNAKMFPDGIDATAKYIRDRGMIPGIWFELESAGVGSEAFHKYKDHFLKRDGYDVVAGPKKFWDMEDPVVIDFLKERVIDFMRDNGFGYMKLDYNDTIGTGCDGYESAGEGLRRKVEASRDFIKKIYEEIPGIVLENCASGGHRLEPEMMSVFSQSSFSDAHECTSIPLIAANLHRTVQPRQAQIWCVLHAEDSRDRTVYSLVNTFLGRMCLSGDVHHLSDEQMDIVREAIAFYRDIVPIIRDGKTVRIETNAKSYLQPEGYQIVERVLGDKKLTVAHKFANAPEIPTPEGKIISKFGELRGDFSACAWVSEI